MSSVPLQDLFDDDDDQVEEGDESFRVNKKYARDYETRKQRQELMNARQQGDYNSDDSSSSEEEDEDGDLLSPSVDINILKTIHALRNEDEKIYDASTRFFPQQDEESNSDDDEDDDSSAEKKHKPKKFKDVIREQIVQQMNQDEDESDGKHGDANDETQRGDDNRGTNHLLYNQEQQELRAAFLESTQQEEEDNSNSDDNEWMVLKKRAKREQEDQQAEQMIQQELEALSKTTTKSKNSSLKDPRGEVEDGEAFLFDFIKNKKWIDKNDDDSSSDDDVQDKEKQPSNNLDDEDSDSMDELDRADDFESKYNFRFEQAEAEAGTSGADFSVVGYARSGTVNTLRRKDESRKLKRQERKERKAAERKAKEEQLRRLKNAKRQEMENKLKQIRAVLGDVEGRGMAVDEATMMKLMEGDYDPEQFEQIMNEAYGDDFYQQQDAEWKTDKDVRESMLQEEDGRIIAGLDDEAGGLYDNVDEAVDDEEYGDDEGDGTDQNEVWDEDEYYDQQEGGKAALEEQEETETERKLKQKMNDELYKLDYEDIIAGMPTRFKYRLVPKNNYGLTTEEILFAKDTTLKSFVSLKKMAPYREDGEYRVGSKKRRRFRDMLKQDIEEAMEELGEMQPEVAKEEQAEAEPPKKKRRRQKKGKKKGDQESDSKPAAIDSKANEDGKPNEAPNKDDTKVKRKRKKKGKKLSKQEGVEDESGSNTVEAIDSYAPKATASIEHESLQVSEEDKAEATVKKSRTKKKHKKKKKAKTVAVEGVSASRLASYNL